jgi:hypothetical protein
VSAKTRRSCRFARMLMMAGTAITGLVRSLAPTINPNLHRNV